MPRLIIFGKMLVGIAAGLAILVSLYILFSPVNVHIIAATAVSGWSEIAQETTTRQSWYQFEGPWGVLVLLLFSGLYGWGYYLARKEAYDWLGVLSLGLLSLSYLSGFSIFSSIGSLYLPAAVVLLVGTGLLVFSRYWQKDPKEPST
jgi:hypothetical protein